MLPNPRWFLVLALSTQTATAVELKLQSDAQLACIDQQRLEAAVESRLGRELSEIANGPQRISVAARRETNAYVAELTLGDAQDKVLGHRRLSVQTDDCRRFRDHLVLVLSLALDPNGFGTRTDGSSSTQDAESEMPEPDAERDRSSASAPNATADPAPTTPTPSAGSATSERLRFGSGSSNIVVYRALLPDGKSMRVHPDVEVEALRGQLARKLGEKLGSYPQWTVLVEPTDFGDRLHTESALRQIARGAWPTSVERPALPAPAGTDPPDYVIVPMLTKLVVSDALDYSQSKRIRVIAAEGTLSLKLVHRRTQRELPEVTLSATISYGGSKHRANDVAAAIAVLVDDLVAQGLDQLRQFADFRRQLTLDASTNARVTFPRTFEPRAGDGYAFLDDDGRLSGFATLRAVESDHAELAIKSTGSGQRLVEVTEYSPWSAAALLTVGSRLGYRRPSDADLARAEETGKRTSSIGADVEVGMSYRALYTGQDNSNWRGMAGLRWTFIAGASNTFSYQVQGGLGYEYAALPWLGITLLPYVQPGLLYVPRGIGSERGNAGQLTALLAATATTGIQFEFYRWFGQWSPTLAVDAEWVMPLLYDPGKSAFLDERMPQLHGLFVSVGGTYRPNRFKESN